MIAVLSGGVGAARLLRALGGVVEPSELTAIVNVGDDLVLHGLTICPDLDTITYTLAGLSNEVLGWGLTGETWRVRDELAALGGEAWFSLGDRDLATHLYRSERLARGATKSEVAAELAQHHGVTTTLLPATDDPLATRFTTELGEMSFQEYFVKHHHDVVVTDISFEGAPSARPTAAVREALTRAERIVIAPSNPLISIEPILRVPGIRDLVAQRRDDVVAISPLVGGAALKGPADRLMRELGHDVSVAGIAALYASLAATLIIDEVDAAHAPQVEAAGLKCVVTTTVMDNPVHARQLAQAVLA